MGDRLIGGTRLGRVIQVFGTFGDFPTTGNERNLYIARDTDNVYVWSITTTAYSEVSNSKFLGWFATPTALQTAHPVGADGEYAIVGTTDTVWVWDTTDTAWEDSGQKKVAAGNDTEIQYNTSGDFDASSDLIWNNTTKLLNIVGDITASGITDGIVKSTSGALSGSGIVSLTTEISGILPIVNGGTNSSTVLNNDRVMISSGGAIVESATITVSELGLLNGILSVSTGIADNDKFVTQGYVDDAITGENIWDRVTGTPNYVIPHVAIDDIGATATRITKGWFTSLEITNMPTVSGVSINTNGILDLTNVEVSQLANIDSVTISNTQWGYLGGLNQTIATTSTPTFASLTISNTPTNDSDATRKDYVDSLVQGLDWQESVLDRYDPTGGLPTATDGHRYIATATANGWTINNIYEGNGSTFDETVVSEGMSVWVENEDIQYTYNGTNWVKFGSTVTHNNLASLQGGNGSTEYYHLTSSDYTELINWLDNITLNTNGSITMETGALLTTEKVQALNSNGLSLYEDGGKGIFIEDSSGYVGIDCTNPGTNTYLQIGDGTAAIRNFVISGAGTSAESTCVVSLARSGNYLGFMAVTKTGLVLGKTGTGISGDTDADTKAQISIQTNDIYLYDNVTIGKGEADVDYTLTFNGETNDGIIKWMEDEDMFDISCNLNLTGALYINSDFGEGQRALQIFDTSMSSGHNLYTQIGQSDSNGNTAEMVFNYIGSDSASNAFKLGFHSQVCLTMLNSGNIGLGTQSPDKRLHVVDTDVTNAHYNLNTVGVFENTAARFQIIGDDATDTGSALVLSKVTASNDNTHWVMYHNPTTSELELKYTNSSASGQEVATVVVGMALQIDVLGNIKLVNDAYLAADEIRARDSGGLTIADDSSTNAIYIADGGAISLLQNTTVANGKYIATDEIRARDTGGLKLYEDGGQGIFVEDLTGYLGIGTTNPTSPLHVSNNLSDLGKIAQFFDPTMSSGDEMYLQIGQSDADGNTAEIGFEYNGVDNNGNRLLLGFHSNNIVNILNSGRVGFKTSSPTSNVHCFLSLSKAEWIPDPTGNVDLGTNQYCAGRSKNLSIPGVTRWNLPTADSTVLGREYKLFNPSTGTMNIYGSSTDNNNDINGTYDYIQLSQNDNVTVMCVNDSNYTNTYYWAVIGGNGYALLSV